MASTYTYSIADDTKFGQWNADRLQQEIENDPEIATILSQKPAENAGNIETVFVDALTVDEETRLGYILSQHEGATIQSYEVVHVEPTGKENTHLVITGTMFEADLGSTSHTDTSFDHERAVQGVIIDVSDHTKGDRIELTFEHPNPSVGTLATFAENVYVPPHGSMNVISEGASTLPAGVIMRVTYHSVALTGEKPTIYVAYRMWVEH